MIKFWNSLFADHDAAQEAARRRAAAIDAAKLEEKKKHALEKTIKENALIEAGKLPPRRWCRWI